MENTNTYIIYIDESNISANTGHSVYVSIFVVCTHKGFTSNQIVNIENSLKISYTHWVDMPWRLRVKFAKRLKELDFVCKFAMYDNPIAQESTLESFLVDVLNANNKVYRIIIDGKKGKRYEQKFKSKLKKHGIGSNNLRFVDDKSEPLVRLADFMAGLIRSSTDDKNAYNEYMLNILSDKIKMPD